MNLKRTMRKTLEKLGVAYSEERTSWKGSAKYGFSPVFSLIVDDSDYENIVKPYRESTRLKRKKNNDYSRKKRRDYLESVANELGVLVGSKTLSAYIRGEIEEVEAKRIGEICRYRHEETDYDKLLSHGYCKEDARILMKKI